MNNKTFIAVIFILILVSIVGLLSYLPTRFDSMSNVKMEDIPKTIGEWSATDIPLLERDYQILETRNLIMREYKNPAGEVVYLYIIYSEGNRKVAHPPEVCFMGSGATIVNKTPLQLNQSIVANKLNIEKDDLQQVVLYWFRAGNLNTDKYSKQQTQFVLNRLLRKRTSGAMIRISTDIKDGKEEPALQRVKSFTAELVPLLDKYVP